MKQDLDEITSELMSLPALKRVELAERLLESLGGAADEKISAREQAIVDKLWLEEAQRRSREIHEGRVKPIPGKQAMKEFEGSLAKRIEQKSQLATKKRAHVT